MFARKFGDQATYKKYIARASNWQNLWMEEATEPSTGVKGFIQAKDAKGAWATQAGYNCETCFVGTKGRDGEFYEESAWSYSWFVPHDYAKIIELVGGMESFVKRLGMNLLCFAAAEFRYLF
jgi:putative alpha-1,2-mannosidase